MSTAARSLRPFALERHDGWNTATTLLSCSDCEAFTMKEVLAMADEECAMEWESLPLSYTYQQGHPLLLEAIAAGYDQITASQCSVVVPQEGILLGAMALLEPGDHVVATQPCYQSLYEVARSIGCEVTAWEPRWDSNGTPFFDTGELETALRPDTKLLVTNFPHNPTGATLDHGEVEEIASMLRGSAGGAFWFSDEMYRLLEHDGPPLPSVADVYERGVTMSGMSKTFSMPGVRIGWLATQHNETFERLTELKDYTTICPPAPSEILATIGLRNADAIVERSKGLALEGKAAAREFCERHDDVFGWAEPRGGSICFPLLQGNASSSKLCRELAQRGIMLVHSQLFEGAGDSRVRFGFARRDFRDSLTQLERQAGDLIIKPAELSA